MWLLRPICSEDIKCVAAAEAATPLAPVIAVGGGALATGVAAGYYGVVWIADICMNEAPDNADEDADRNSKQDKRLSPGEIKKLKEAGIDPEQIKKSWVIEILAQ